MTNMNYKIKPKVVVLHSEILDPTRLDELDTLVQVEEIEAALHASGYETFRLPYTNIVETGSILQGMQNIVVFNLVESINGKSEFLHAPALLLETLQIPFTGNDSNALMLTLNKILAKTLMKSAGIPTAPWYYPQSGVGRNEASLDGQYIIKPAAEGGSVGIDQDSVVSGFDAMQRILQKKIEQFGGKWFAELFIDGREFNISMVDTPKGLQVLPISEICFDFAEGRPKVVTYDAKWTPDHPDNIGTVVHFPSDSIDSELLAKLKLLAIRCWETFSLKSYARVDVRVDHEGQPWVLEINGNPCLSSDAGFCRAVLKAGLNMPTIMKWLVKQ